MPGSELVEKCVQCGGKLYTIHWRCCCSPSCFLEYYKKSRCQRCGIPLHPQSVDPICFTCRLLGITEDSPPVQPAPQKKKYFHRVTRRRIRERIQEILKIVSDHLQKTVALSGTNACTDQQLNEVGALLRRALEEVSE